VITGPISRSISRAVARGLSEGIRGAPAWSLLDLFANGEAGVHLDFSADHTSPGTLSAAIATATDLSPNGVDGASGATEPTLEQTAGGLQYAAFGAGATLSVTLPAIAGTLCIVGPEGVWFDEAFSAGAGAWTLGDTSATGQPANLLGALGGVSALIIVDRALSAYERDSLESWGRVRGGSGGEIRAVSLEDGSGYLLTEDDNVIYTEAA